MFEYCFLAVHHLFYFLSHRSDLKLTGLFTIFQTLIIRLYLVTCTPLPDPYKRVKRKG